jgi:EAL domain-containing protein (putative c-di-GMP-specific phosphodiesterase class I)/ActR/RegA family two-component response regulator
MSLEKIFIIDDEQQMLDMLTEFIELMGYEVSSYLNARQFFIENTNEIENSLLIFDLNMPDIDGMDVIKLLADKGFQLPLILISGYDSGILHSAEKFAHAHDLDIISIFSKPIHFLTLKKIIHDYVSSNFKVEKQTASVVNKLELTVDELKQAIDKEQLLLHYQPQINIKTGVLVGVEALVRLQHPQYGLIYPDLFISLAEQNNLIGELTEQVIYKATKQSLFWKEKGLNIQVAVNISADNITSHSLPDQLQQLLQEHRIDPLLLTLEVTESSLMRELVTSLEILTRLRMKGIELSIDDFGTGYSSLSQLYRMPFTELKVDQNFVMNMAQDNDARGIVKTCIILAHELKMSVVAEGVEDKETLLLLKEMGCDIAQGYYFAKAMPADNLIEWNQNRRKAND